jgi:hypothetical protein
LVWYSRVFTNFPDTGAPKSFRQRSSPFDVIRFRLL